MRIDCAQLAAGIRLAEAAASQSDQGQAVCMHKASRSPEEYGCTSPGNSPEAKFVCTDLLSRDDDPPATGNDHRAGSKKAPRQEFQRRAKEEDCTAKEAPVSCMRGSAGSPQGSARLSARRMAQLPLQSPRWTDTWHMQPDRAGRQGANSHAGGSLLTALEAQSHARFLVCMGHIDGYAGIAPAVPCCSSLCSSDLHKYAPGVGSLYQPVGCRLVMAVA